MTADYVQVLTTVSTEEEAERISAELVDAGLAACVQVFGPLKSHYVWNGKMEHAQEWSCLAKTESRLYSAVEEAIRAIHSYEEPEIVALPIVAGSRGYLDWITQSLGG